MSALPAIAQLCDTVIDLDREFSVRLPQLNDLRVIVSRMKVEHRRGQAPDQMQWVAQFETEDEIWFERMYRPENSIGGRQVWACPIKGWEWSDGSAIALVMLGVTKPEFKVVQVKEGQ